MRSSNFLGPAYADLSKNLALQQSINLYFSPLDGGAKGKAEGSLRLTPGLTLLATCGNGPIRGVGGLGTTLYVVSGNQVYSVTTGWVATLLGTINTNSGPVSIINSPTQLVIFDGIHGYLVPGGAPLTGGTLVGGGLLGVMSEYAVGDTVVLQAQNGTQTASAVIQISSIAPSSVPLTGGTIGGVMANYAIGDTINLAQAGGTQVVQAQLTVTGVSAGAVTSVSVSLQGAFSSNPTSFSQGSTSGIGSGFTYTAPAFGAEITGIP